MIRRLKPSFKSTAPWLGVAALLFVLAAPPAAAGATSSLALLGIQSPAAYLFGAAPAAKKDPIGGPSAQSTCIAHCGDGSTVTCSGSTCNATDNLCSEDPSVSGQCYGSSSGYQYCPTCPGYTTPCQRISCELTDGTSCSTPGAHMDCTSLDGQCGFCDCELGTWRCAY